MKSVFESAEVSQALFYPRRTHIENPTIVSCGNAELACLFHEVPNATHTVVFFHGNGETVADFADIFPGLFSVLNCNTFLAEYRGYGLSSGRPSLGNLIEDCQYILQSIPTPPEKNIFFGRSLGCLAAVKAVSLTPNASGLILESGIRDIGEYVNSVLQLHPRTWGFEKPFYASEERVHSRCDISECFNVKRVITQFSGPAVVSYSLLDRDVFVKSGEDIFSWIAGPKRLIVSDIAGHNSIIRHNIAKYCEAINDMVNGCFS